VLSIVSLISTEAQILASIRLGNLRKRLSYEDRNNRAGYIARAVATVALRHGHEVMVSNTRGPGSLFSLTRTIGCKAGSPEEAAAFGDIVLAAIPLKNYRSIPVGCRSGTASSDG
jgi:hypothetical protein